MPKKWSEYQQAIFDEARDGIGHVVVVARAGSGKCLGIGTLVMLADGRVVPVERIAAGNTLMGPDSAPRSVLSTTTGRGPLFRIVPTKGEPWVCNGDHILVLAGTNRVRGQSREVSVNALLAEGGDPNRNWKLLRTGVTFPSRPVPVDPYLVGLWIGDGTTDDATITNCDPEIIEYCKMIGPAYGAETVLTWSERNHTYNIRFRMGVRGKTGRHTPHPLRRFFKRISIGGKRIPDEYLYNTAEVRRALLAGWIDTDGSCGGVGCDIVTVSDVLASQLLFLARSLGLAAYRRDKHVPINGKVIRYNRISISGDLTTIPVRVPRRRTAPRLQTKRVTVTGFRIETLAVGDYYGFTLDGDGRFLLGDFTVTHNTTTIVEALSHLPHGGRVLLCAFNKRIQEELQRRVPVGVDVKTLHGLGYGTVLNAWGKTRVNQYRVADMLDEMMPHRATRGDVLACAKLVSMAKNVWVRSADDLADLAGTMRLDSEVLEPEELAVIGWSVMEKCKIPDGSIDFDDMVWLPCELGMQPPLFDVVFVDEAQDMNAPQLYLARRACREGGRIFIVGDDRQAIYAWRGADAEAMPRMISELHARVLPLSVTYRCPRSVVSLAQEIVPDIRAWDGATEGEVKAAADSDLVKATPGDFVLSRTNAPLMPACLRLLRQGVRATVQGRSVGKALITLIQKTKAADVPALITWMETYREQEHRKVDASKKIRDKAAAYEIIDDKVDTILSLTEGVSSIGEMTSRMDRLFADDGPPRVICSTVHRAKGLESDRVWMLMKTYRPMGTGVEEDNIRYVAITRAMRSLQQVYDRRNE